MAAIAYLRCDDPACYAGWIDDDDRTRPCPTCRPEQAAALATAGTRALRARGLDELVSAVDVAG